MGMKISNLLVLLNMLFVLSTPDKEKCPKCKHPGFVDKCKKCGFTTNIVVVEPDTSDPSSDEENGGNSGGGNGNGNGGGDNGNGGGDTTSSSCTDSSSDNENGGGENGGGDNGGGDNGRGDNGGGDSLNPVEDGSSSSSVLFPPVSVENFDYFKNGPLISKYRRCQSCTGSWDLKPASLVIHSRKSSCRYISKAKFKSAVFKCISYFTTSTKKVLSTENTQGSSIENIQDSHMKNMHDSHTKDIQDSHTQNILNSIDSIYHLTTASNCNIEQLINLTVIHLYYNFINSHCKSRSIIDYKKYMMISKDLDPCSKYRGIDSFINILKCLKIIENDGSLNYECAIRILDGKYKPSNPIEINFFRIMNTYFTLSKEILGVER